MKKLSTALYAMMIALIAIPASAQLDPTAAKELYDRVAPSLVIIQYTYDGELGRQEITGTGIVVSNDGLVMTSLGLMPPQIPDAQMIDFKIIIPGDDEVELAARFEGRDERSNTTFVKATESHDWRPIKFEDLPVDVGDHVVSVGLLPKAAGYKAYMTQTRVSANLRGPTPQVLVGGDGLGSVGSPVFNIDGKAIGMVQMGMTGRGDEMRNPLAAVVFPPRMFTPTRDFELGLQDPPTAEKPLALPWIGVSSLAGLEKEVAEYYGIKGQAAIQIGDVIPGGPAEKAGIKSGMIVLQVNGERLERGDQPDEIPQILMRKIRLQKVGSDLALSIITEPNQKEAKDFTLTLEERPMPVNKAQRFFARDLGFSVREMVFDDLYERNLPADTQGVIIALIQPDSSAQSAKLMFGDLIKEMNQTPVTSLPQFREFYESFRKDRPREAVVLEVLRGGNTQIIRIEPPQ
jgi:serine protease Do